MNSNPVGWTRRKALQVGALTSAAMALPGVEALAQTGGKKAQKPLNIVFLVSDGMSAGVPPMAEAFSQMMRGKGTFWQQLAEDPGVSQGFFNMASMSSMVTDSAAAASSWGSGRRVMNGVLNEYPDGTKLKTLCRLLQENGWNTGLASTARITHATPAGFFAAVPFRDLEDLIAEQYLQDGPMVLLGGGRKFFTAEGRKGKVNILPDFQARNYQVAMNREELLRVKSGRVLGLFDQDHLPYSLDCQGDEKLLKEVPTLAEMAGKALDLLAGEGKPFFLMIEAARVDMAAHANDAAGLLWDQLAFDDAIGTVLEFQKLHPDTLVVISSDHGNANPGENGMGKGYNESTPCFERLQTFKRTSSWIRNEIEKREKEKELWDAVYVAKLVKRASGFEISWNEASALAEAFRKMPVADFSNQQKSFYGVLGQILGNHTGVGWTGVTHTSDWTQRLAKGPGQEIFNGLIRNTEFFDKVLALSGIEFRNPEYRVSIPKVVLPPVSVADPTG